MRAGSSIDQHRLVSGNFTSLNKLPPATPSSLFTLPGGEQLAYDEFGAADGFPLFYFHDGGSSRLEGAFFHRSARQLGYRLIAVDRPGIGCSDYYSVNTASDFCDHVLLLADCLGIAEFGVLSLGAGGIYAVNLGHAEPQRITAHLSLAGIPGSVFNESDGRSYVTNCWNELTPPLIKFLVRVKHRFFRDDLEESIERFKQYLSNIDRKTLANPRVAKMLALDYREALRRGYDGVAQDLAICFRKLDFSLREVPVPTIVWQGCADRLTKRIDCEYMVARMPHATFHRVPSHGHFFFVHNMEEVFARLRSRTGANTVIAA